MMETTRKSLILKADVTGQPRTLRFCISDETLDRDGDIVETAAWDFSEFQKNPQFLGFHDYQALPVGIPKSWKADSRTKRTTMDVYFPTVEELATNPEYASEKARIPDTIYCMYKAGMLNAVSVGFQVVESVDRQPDAGGPQWARGKIVKKARLLEVSAVPIPSNPNAILEARAVKSFSPEVVAALEKEQPMAKAEPLVIEMKAGRTISKETAAKLKGCHGKMAEALNELAAMIPGDDEEEKPKVPAKPEAEAEKPGEAPEKGIDLAAMDGATLKALI